MRRNLRHERQMTEKQFEVLARSYMTDEDKELYDRLSDFRQHPVQEYLVKRANELWDDNAVRVSMMSPDSELLAHYIREMHFYHRFPLFVDSLMQELVRPYMERAATEEAKNNKISREERVESEGF